MKNHFLRFGRFLSFAVVLSLSSFVYSAIAPSVVQAAPLPVLSYMVNQSFDGTSTFVDKSSHISTVSSLTTGAIKATFRTTSTDNAKTIFSASNTLEPSSNLSLTINNGRLYFEVRENGSYKTQLSHPTDRDPTTTPKFNDGKWHTVLVTVDSTGTKIYADGYQVTAGTSTSFFSAVNGLNGMWVGKNVDNGGSQWFYSGDIGIVQIFDQSMPMTDVLSFQTPSSTLKNYDVHRSFNGTTDFVDKSSDLSAVAALSSGTIAGKFKTTSTAGVKTLFSASDKNDPSSNITLSVNTGDLHFEVRENGVYSSQIDIAGSYNDGNWHTFVVSVSATTGTKVYIDGYRLYTSSTTTGFFSSVNTLNGMWIGKNIDNGGSQWYFNGEIASVKIYSEALGDNQSMLLSNNIAPVTDFVVNKTFNGTTDFVDKTSALGYVSSLSKGSIMARFKTTATGVKTLISASDTNDASSNVTMSINDGNLYFEVRESGVYSSQITIPGTYNDGQWHTYVVSVSASGTRIYIDGYELYEDSAATGFFSAVNTLSGMWIGKNIDNGGSQWYFNGEIEAIQIFDYVLHNSEVKRLSNATPLDTIALFDAGYSGSQGYRIPALLTTTQGTLIAAADKRISSQNDSPNNIDLVVRRSTDQGATWSASQVLLDYPGVGLDGASTIDAVLLQDAATGTIFLIVDHFPGGTGALNAEAGVGFDANGYLLLRDSLQNVYTLRPNGNVYDSNNQLTNYLVDSDGNVTVNGSPRGNIYLKPGVDPNESLFEFPTSYLKLLKSDDDGITWSDPIDLNPQVKESWMPFLGTGPGIGIQMNGGTYDGRLIVPVYFFNSVGGISNAVIYSDDHGVTWERSESPNDGRVWNGGTLDSLTLTDNTATLHESQVVQMNDGTLRLYMRNNAGNKLVAVTNSSDGGATWGTVTFDDELPEYYSMLSVIKYPELGDSKERILISNPSRRTPTPSGFNLRVDGVVRLSEDGGVNWKYAKMVKSGAYVYSSLTVLPSGEIGLLYEQEFIGLFFTKFPLTWLTSP